MKDSKVIGQANFAGYSCDVWALRYRNNGALAIQLTERGTDRPLAIATVNLEEEPAPGCVWAKDWMENEGIVRALTKAGIWGTTGRVIPVGHTVATECMMLAEVG